MKTVMLVFGTRPEAIKMCPLVNELKTRKGLKTVVCVTGQHRQMLDQVLAAFGVEPDYDLSIMKDKQTLFDITTNILNRIRAVLEEVRPDVVLVHGDTSTTFVTALACFYLQIPVGHVEAGLRTYNIYSPYPEEFNRQAVSIISQYNFAPTARARDNLLHEGKRAETIFVTGNTAIDALQTTVREDYTHPELTWAQGSRLIVITAHRRENLGEPMHHMFRAIRRVLDRFSQGFSDGESYADLVSRLLYGGDEYLLLADFDSYRQAHCRALEVYAEPARWNRMSLMNIARSGIFAADRSIKEYAENIWHVPTR